MSDLPPPPQHPSGFGAPPSPTPPFPTSQGPVGGRDKPDNYLVWAILATVLCCLPFGVVSIVNASKVDSLWAAGAENDARQASADAKQWAIWSAVAWVVLVAVYIIFFLFVAATRASGAPAAR